MQSTVNLEYAMGVIGDFVYDGPQRVRTAIINSAGANPNIVGYAFTLANGTGIASVGGTTGATVIFGGILVRPKEYASNGTTSDPLAATLTIPDNTQGELATMGFIVVALGNACNIGDQVEFNQTDGHLQAVAPAAAADVGYELIPNAQVYDTVNAAAGIAVVRLTQ